MCGIIGCVGDQNISRVIVEGLRRLEYRGYDSAGIAIIHDQKIELRRAMGKLSQLETLLQEKPLSGIIGIGHTRWATHGKPSEINAHPHRSGGIVLVHNGIIENYNQLRAMLIERGHIFESETDTEVACHLIDYYFQTEGDMLLALRKALSDIKGNYAFVIMHESEPDRLYLAKHGSPLVLGANAQMGLVASDIPALLSYTNEVIFLEDHDLAVIEQKKTTIYSADGKEVSRPTKHIPWTPFMAERGGYKHFMLKEIHEQPQVIEDAFTGRISLSEGKVTLDELQEVCGNNEFPFDEITIVACGTSYHAGVIGKYLIESLAKVRVSVELASEFRYREPVLSGRTLLLPISQSGETADTLAAIKKLKLESKITILSICNVVGSAIPRLSDATLYNHAGPEIGVASTKAFTTQLILLYLLALDISFRRKTMSDAEISHSLQELLTVPREIDSILMDVAPSIQELAKKYAASEHIFYLGRGIHFPSALEGALKLKEISYIHAEGYAAGELKHGPIALIDKGVPVIAICLQDQVHEKMLSNVEEVKARGAKVLMLATEGDVASAAMAENSLFLPASSWCVSPLFVSVALQLFAYYVADHKGTDVDQPRNLAKSVTVE